MLIALVDYPLDYPLVYLLTLTQGELLDQIEYTVGQSVNYTGRAVEELRTANKYQKKVRRKMCLLICCCLVILGAFLGPTLYSLMQVRNLPPISLLNLPSISLLDLPSRSPLL
jgi:t-SNARE complex subunit, syntaxin